MIRRLALLFPVLMDGLRNRSCPDRRRRAGFGDYASYAAGREAELRGRGAARAGQPLPPAQGASGAPLSALAPAPARPATGGAGRPGDGLAQAEHPEPAPAAAVPAQASPAQISAAKSGAAGPNLAAYALAATQAPGSAVYPRGGIHLVSSEKACAGFVSPDLAQIAFLEAGGPEKDRKNLDPDGDGFACGWDPRSVRPCSKWPSPRPISVTGARARGPSWW
ncbi:MAG: hypothetical protein R3D78_11950 [Paracoccaceae bacterium]